MDTNKTTVRFFVVGSELQFKKKARPFLDTSKHGRREDQSLPQSGLLESDTRVDTSYDRQNADQSFVKGRGPSTLGEHGLSACSKERRKTFPLLKGLEHHGPRAESVMWEEFEFLCCPSVNSTSGSCAAFLNTRVNVITCDIRQLQRQSLDVWPDCLQGCKGPNTSSQAETLASRASLGW